MGTVATGKMGPSLGTGSADGLKEEGGKGMRVFPKMATVYFECFELGQFPESMERV